MPIRLIHDTISREDLADLAKEYFEELIKGVVDVGREVIALGGNMHADAEAMLLQDGSKQSDLWGFNILLGKPAEECLAYHSFINIRPRQGNRGIEIENQELRDRMRGIILRKVPL